MQVIHGSVFINIPLNKKFQRKIRIQFSCFSFDLFHMLAVKIEIKNALVKYILNKTLA